VSQQPADGMAARRAPDSPSLLSAIVKSSDDAIVGKTMDGTITSWNPAAERLYGYSPGEIIGQPITTLCPPDWVGEIKGFLARIARGERVVHHRTAALERANENLESFTYSVAHDLRAPLRALGGFSAALLEDCEDDLGEIGRGYATRIMDASDQMAQLIDDLLDLSRVARAEVRLQQVDLGAEAARIVAELQRREPGRRVAFTAQPASAQADHNLIRTVLQNLLENAWKFTGRRDEASIEFGTGPTGDGRICYYVRDDGAGFDPAYAGKLFTPFQRLHSTLEFPGTGVGLASVRRIVERHGGRVWAEGAVGAGATFYFTLEAEEPGALPTHPGSTRGTAGDTMTGGAEPRDAREAREQYEVSAGGDRRIAREAQERKDRSLIQAQRLESLGQLAGGVAHDFNNLLAVILNYASFAAEDVAAAAGPDPAPHLESAGADLVQIKKAAEQAARLTRQLLRFARRDVIRPQVLDLDSVITAVEDMLRRTLGAHVELVITRAGNLWPVLADPGQLEQVLVNLAVNARDAMPDGGTLTIDTSNITVDADSIAGGSKARIGPNVRVQVSDTGTGMTAETLEHLFEPFFTTKRDSGGTGLGLATVYGILMQADGNIQIHSEPGVGTTFTIILPVTSEAAAPIVEPAPYQRTPKGETVLVVEDEAALLEVTRRILSRNGYQVITAADGPEAIAIARSHPGEIHLLVTDVVMPNMLGKEVAEKVRAVKPGIEVLFMSGYARPVLASQGRLDPNVALVEKPFSEADLLTMAGQVLNGHFRGFTTSRSVPEQ
jgi:signal transduction histidine kinase